MTTFSLPGMQADQRPLFVSATECTAWLGTQPLANAPAMQGQLAAQLTLLNTFEVAPRERFKILEALRTPVFAVQAECVRRFEYRPLPLALPEQTSFDTSRRLWRAMTTGYLHCLRACLDGAPNTADLAAKGVHRALVGLRMEQDDCYLAGIDIGADFWGRLHAVLAAAEQLGVLREQIGDRLRPETSASSAGAHYAMAILLHLARPYELSRSQFAAVSAWLARWRETAEILSAPTEDGRSATLALDLACDQPLSAAANGAATPRWLEFGGVLRKIRKRQTLLREGQSPESLKLGKNLTPDACLTLLQYLYQALRQPQPDFPPAPAGAPAVRLVAGIENIYTHLGGQALNISATSLQSNRRTHDQIAIFGHAGHASVTAPPQPVLGEDWRIVSELPRELWLTRSAASGKEQLKSRGLVALQMPGQTTARIAVLRSLMARGDGTLCAIARLLPGTPTPTVVTARERPSGAVSRHPALLLPATGVTGTPLSLLLGAGIAARSMSLSAEHLPQGSQPGTLIERGADFERLSCESPLFH